ncbi:glycosyltransferase [Seleniivibrio woodruffii]|uniref:glycosyltransferase n=1 Tax=Seleniivibrio woodruffii TaxID=1078050 RepID=UPI002409FAF5|nr:glycosyltransferase [Seleniivibrio woodruffii]
MCYKNEFSVLISIYHKENASFFSAALKSIWDDQEVKPNEIVIVQDGKLTDELYCVIDNFKQRISCNLIIINLKNNVGLGLALNEGLKHCTNELVARMDTDDISLPERFKEQLTAFKDMDIDICGTNLLEFSDDESVIDSVKKVPESNSEIIKFARYRNPINHPTVMFKKSKIMNIGGYQHFLWFEDYYLWARAIQAKYIFYNIQQPLIKMRTGNNMISRRHGIKYAKQEIKFQNFLLSIGLISVFIWISNIFTRIIPRLLPVKILSVIYKLLRKG